MRIQRQILDIKFSPQVLLWVYKIALPLKKFSQPLSHKIVDMRQRPQKYFWLMNFEVLIYTCCPEIQVPSFPWTYWSQIPVWGLVIYSYNNPQILRSRSVLRCLYNFWWCCQVIARNCNSWNTTRYCFPSNVTKLHKHFLISPVQLSHHVLLTFFCPFECMKSLPA